MNVGLISFLIVNWIFVSFVGVLADEGAGVGGGGHGVVAFGAGRNGLFDEIGGRKLIVGLLHGRYQLVVLLHQLLEFV